MKWTRRSQGDGPAPLAAAVRVAAKVDDAFEPDDNPANEVLLDDGLAIRLAGPVFLGCALVLLPWIVVTGLTLPSRKEAAHYDLAWAGFDVALFLAITLTAVTTLRRSRYLGIASSATAAMLLVDAWFDTVTASDTSDFLQALLLTCVAEVPLATVCLWLALHAADLEERRLNILRRDRSQWRGASS